MDREYNIIEWTPPLIQEVDIRMTTSGGIGTGDFDIQESGS